MTMKYVITTLPSHSYGMHCTLEDQLKPMLDDFVPAI